MCGIAGEIDFKGSQDRADRRSVYERMQQTLRRRGPDQKGVFLSEHAALIHTRLSVVDLEKGKQPMKLSFGGCDYVLIYNGELYNTQELRTALKALGHSFEGHSDTEVLLHAYAQWKESWLDRLNGIFAFAVWDTGLGRLFIARDRMGVKPFFYALINDCFLFSTEIKALLAHPLVRPEIDLNSIAELMLIGPGRTPGCGVFRSIKELAPAECGYYTESGLNTHLYWTLKDRTHTDSFQETVDTVRFLVTDSITRQLVSDVPVSTFLSGGLDSSIISAVADSHFSKTGKRLHTFSVDYKDNDRYFKASKFQPNSDKSYIEIMNGFLNAEHHLIELDTSALADALYEAVEARDLPGMADVDASLLLFCREIKKHATVALSGECADEIFGGYPWYRDQEIRERDGFPWAQSTAYRLSFLRPEFSQEIDAYDYVRERYRKTVTETHVLPENTGEQRIREMVNLNLNWFMQTLLDRKDRMSMYSGLEVRVPYCDFRIAEYLYAVPWAYKDWENCEKGLLRKAMEGILPEQVLWRKKSPYPKTHNPAYLKTVSDRLREVLADPNSPVLQFVNREALETLLVSSNPIPWYGQLMTTPQTIAYFLQVDYWMRTYKVSIV
jgi:asparagine synthase (glutamine-hydrolysing)